MAGARCHTDGSVNRYLICGIFVLPNTGIIKTMCTYICLSRLGGVDADVAACFLLNFLLSELALRASGSACLYRP